LKLFCYVYYRVLPDRVTQASVAARNTIDALRAMTGVDVRLMTKVAEPLLWMEAYEDIGDQEAFLSAMRQCVEQSGLVHCLADGGKRHTEVFRCA
jgi:hypothetical protein